MPIEGLLSSYTDAINRSATNTSAPPQSTPVVAPFLPGYSNEMAKFVSEYAFHPSGEPSNSGNGVVVSSTFGSNPNPTYDLNSPSDIGSNDGRTAANGLLRMEQFGGEMDPLQSEAQLVSQTLGQHKNDPQFLKQYLGTLGSGRTASIFSYISSLGNVQTPFNAESGAANPRQLNQEYQNVADALSTLVNDHDFSQGDMDKFVAEFAKTNPQVNFFAKDVLSKASPAVNQMFFQSAKNYALQNANSGAGQSMAAYAMQALSQTSDPLPVLQKLPNDQLSTLVTAAMKGDAAYGNPPTIEQLAKTGVFRAADGQGAPLDGLSRLMFDAAYSNVGDGFSPAPLTTAQANDLQSRLFQAAVSTMQSDSNVQGFVQQSSSMKNALAVDFQQGYDSISKAYSSPDGEMTSAGMSAFREFFADAVFSPPPSVYAKGAIQTVEQKIAGYLSNANKMSASAQPSQQQIAYAESLGEQGQALAAGLKQCFASILNGSAQADQSTKDLLNSLIDLGGAGVGLLGPEASIGSAIVGEALHQLVNSSQGSGPSDVQDAVRQLAGHGINVNGYDPGALYDLSTKVQNANYRMPFQLGMDTAATVLYNG